MAKRSEVMGGLKILEKYDTGDGHEFLRAAHDQIWAGIDASAVSAEDRAELERMGWFVSEEAWSRFV